MNRCAGRGGHLVNIETEAENHFLSHVYAADLNGIFASQKKFFSRHVRNAMLRSLIRV